MACSAATLRLEEKQAFRSWQAIRIECLTCEITFSMFAAFTAKMLRHRELSYDVRSER